MLSPARSASTARSTTRWAGSSLLTSSLTKLLIPLFAFPQIGACRHGDRCSRKHQRPVHSQTLVAWNVYQNPANDPACTLSPAELQEDFDAFYTDMYMWVISSCLWSGPPTLATLTQPVPPQRARPVRQPARAPHLRQCRRPPHRQRLRALRPRARVRKGLREPQRPVVRWQAALGRAQPRQRLPRGMLSAKRRGQL